MNDATKTEPLTATEVGGWVNRIDANLPADENTPFGQALANARVANAELLAQFDTDST